MTDTPERIWIDPRTEFDPNTTWCTLSYGTINVEYVRKDVSDALVAAETDRCAVLCENTEMGVPMKSSDADCANYASMKRDKNAAGTHAGMGYAALIRGGKDND